MTILSGHLEYAPQTMRVDWHRVGTKKQLGVVIASSICLTIFYSYLDVGALRNEFHEGTFITSQHIQNNFSHYLVDGPHCRIPRLDPYHWSVRKYINTLSYASCRNNLPHIVLLRRSPDSSQVKLVIDRQAADKYFRGVVTCCYKEVTRLHESDNSIRTKEEICFKNSTNLFNSTQMVTVICAKYFKTLKLRRKSNILYENMYYIIVLTELVKAKLEGQAQKTKHKDNKYFEMMKTNIFTTSYKVKKQIKNGKSYRTEDIDNKGNNFDTSTKNQLPNSNDLKTNIVDKVKRRDFKDKLRENEVSKWERSNNSEEQLKLQENKDNFHDNTVTNKPQEEDLSLLIIGIDSISRLNLIRAMPRTREFLINHGWFELEGYNKVGENTLPNLLPLLTGRSRTEISSPGGCNPNLKGFFDPCPMIWKDLAAKNYITSYAEDLTEISTFNYRKMGFQKQPTDYYWRPLLFTGERSLKKKRIAQMSKYCVGASMEAELFMKYTHEFVNQFYNYSYFHLVWMNAFSHNTVNGPSRMDKKILEFFSNLNYTALSNTAVIFLSDHGIRFGPIRETFSGWYEERLPFIFFSLPDWYQKKYPHKIANLRANKNRLTSPYDVYNTLNELTRLSNRSKCEKCSSLLQPIDLNRSCKDILIPENWCTCSEMRSLSHDDPRAPELGRVVVKHIDSLLSNHRDSVKQGFRCANLTLSKVHSLQSNKNPIVVNNTTSELLVVKVETAPSSALFEAMVVMRDYGWEVIGDVSRLNMYGNQGACLKDDTIHLFCYCEAV